MQEEPSMDAEQHTGHCGAVALQIIWTCPW